MTNDRAVEIMQAIIFIIDKDYYSDEVETAIHMAINALKAQESCNELATNLQPSKQDADDTISRRAAIDAVEFGITYAKAIDVNTGESKELFKEGNDALKKAAERIKELPFAQPDIIRCCKCGFWDRDTLRHQFNDFRDWNEAECMILAERDPYHEMDRYTEADDYCSMAERRTDGD